MKIKNTSRRAFIVNAADVKKGGELTHDKALVYINPGDTVDINDEVGQKIADGYDDIMVVEKAKRKEPKEAK